MEVSTGPVTIRVASSPQDVEFVRQARNSCRRFMTGTQEEISKRQQERWWASLDRKTALVFVVEQGKASCGYGLVRVINHKTWVTGGLLPQYRGAGIGRALFGFFKEIGFEEDVYLDVLESNIKARHLYESLGWYEIDRYETPYGVAIVMRVDSSHKRG